LWRFPQHLHMLQLDVAVERQITVVEKRVTAPSHADERLAEHGALDQLFGRLREVANGKVELSTGHQTRDFPRSGVLNNICRFGASVANAAIKEGRRMNSTKSEPMRVNVR
jgi:hypothetical protein